jgi:hypothetical protein
MTDELGLLQAANPVSVRDLPDAPEELYDRIARRRPERRLPIGRILAAATAAAAIGLAVTALPGRLADERRGGVIELALAAVSEGPVIHAVVEGPSEFATTLVDLESGETTAEAPRSEVWFDQERELRRSRVSIGETVIFEGVGWATMLDPALAGFTSRYRDALESGRARVVGETTVDGRRAVLLRISLNPGGLAEEVAVDADDYRPLEFRLVPGPDDPVASGRSFRVVSIETIARNRADFTPPPDRLTAHGGIAHDEGEVTVAEASTALGRPGLWPGGDVQGVMLRKIERLRVETRWFKGRTTLRPVRPIQPIQPDLKTEKPALVFHYGPGREAEKTGPWLTMTVGTSAEELPLVGPFPHQRVPTGKLRLTEVGDRLWFGAMEQDGLHFKFESPQRELVLEAARSLSPLE